MERLYESMIILRPDLTEEERETAFDKISKKIKDLGGKVVEAKVWSKEREFCYPIKSRAAGKKRYRKGLYWLVNFTLNIDALGDLKETVRLEEKILRNLIIKRSVT
jgi:ribosomal protein S6